MKDLDRRSQSIIEKIITRFIEYLDIKMIFNFSNINFDDDKIATLIKDKKTLKENIKDSIIICDNLSEYRKYMNENIIFNLFDINGFYLDFYNSDLKISINGKYINYEKTNIDNFKVLAIMHVYNEEDIIEASVEHLIDEGIDVYIIDNWSKDNTSKIIDKLIEKYPNKVFTEKYPIKHDNNCYDWKGQLERTEELSKTLDYDWFVHHDADECHVSPFKGATLKETIYFIDSLGFNIIENSVIFYRLTDKKQTNIFMQDTYFEFGKTPGCFVQSKTWKKSDVIDLKSSGGHIADIPNQKIYPFKILNKHYPFRTIEQARKKVFIDRKQRFKKEEKDIGWHIQYDSINNDDDLIYDIKNLILWDKETFDRYYTKLFIDARF